MLFNPRLIVRASVVAVLLNLVAPVSAQTAVPTLSSPLPAVALAANGGTGTVDLGAHFTLPGVSGQVVQFETPLGSYNAELLAADAPLTVANFLRYVNRGAYNGTLFHRLVPRFIIQGGGFTLSLPINAITADAPVANEFRRANLRGTIAMAKLGNDPNSATNQWFVNLADNRANLDNQNGGFTVFARVLGTGMTVVDALSTLQVVNLDNGVLASIPLRDFSLNQPALELRNLVGVTRTRVIPIHPTASQAGVFAYSATSSAPGVATASVAGATLTVTPVAAGNAVVTVTARDVNGNQATGTVAVTVAGGLAITRQPESATVAPGSGVTLRVEAAAEAALSYQWTKNGTALPGRTGAQLALTGLAAGDSGDYRVTVTAGGASVTSTAATLLVATPQPGRLINLAVRSRAGAGDQTLIAGFVTSGGSQAGNLRLRALGPKLSEFDVPGVLADPRLEVFRGDTVIASNDNVAAGEAASFGLAAGNLDSALAINLTGDAYTAQVTGAAGGQGVALIEINDGAPDSADPALPRLINVAARTAVGTGADILIAGFTINGNVPKRVLLRALGPRLTEFGVGGVLADPKLELFRGETLIAANDDVSAADAAAAGLTVGTKDSALVVVLTPGAYTAQVSGVGGTTGVALIEVNDLP